MDFARFMRDLVLNIDYDNFKNRVAEDPKQLKYELACHDVWGVMRGLQR